MAVAHPTPLSTFMAPLGQLRWQAPHSIQASALARMAYFFPSLNTPCGQTMLHMPQFIQSEGVYARVLLVLVNTFTVPQQPEFVDEQQFEVLCIDDSLYTDKFNYS